MRPVSFFYVFDISLCSPRPKLFDQKYSKNCNIYIYMFSSIIFASFSKKSSYPLEQCLPTLFLEAHQQCTFWMSPLSDQYISGPGVSTNELIQVCLIRKSCKMCSVAVPPGTGLGNTALEQGCQPCSWWSTVLLSLAPTLIKHTWL